MKRSTRWTMAAAAAALLTLPVVSTAQTPPAQPPTTQPATAGDTTTQAPPSGALEHLRQARATLDSIKVTTLSARNRTQFNELNRRLTALERSAGATANASATAQANRTARSTAPRGSVNWGTEVAAIDKILTNLLGAAATTTAGTAGTTGTSGRPGAKPAATATLDEETRTKLTEFRTHITAYATAMAGGGETKKDETPAPEPAAAAAASSTTSSAASTSATGATGTTSAPGPLPPTQAAATAQVDTETARKHLTEARNTLSAMTQLPAAAQLAGDARTQVSQLISNFNELITTQSEWRGSYAKVDANLTALLGAPEPSAAASGTAGAVGTSGSAAVKLDPAIREKLVEMRRHLTAFQQAAGGTEASARTETAAPTAATPETATPAQGATAAPSSNADLMRHVAAIEALLKTTDDSGGLTLTKAQVEQLRTHWAALRTALDKK